MSPTFFLERSFAYSARFAIAVRNLGFWSALRTFRAFRGKSNLISIDVPRLGRRVFFRGRADKGVISHLFYPGTRILDSEARPVKVIVDAGANIGIETLRMRHFHPGARVIAVEPDEGNFRVLQKNVEHDRGFVETLPKGLWSSETALRVLPGTTNEAFSVRPAEPGEAADVEAITMAALLALAGGEIDILKMDIEGTEFEVFSKDTAWTRHVKVFIFECPDRDHPGAAAQIFRTLADEEFDTFVSGENIVLIRRDTGWDVETTAYL